MDIEVIGKDRIERRAQDRVWRVWWECEGCRGEVGHDDRWCKHCGRKFA